MGWPAIAGRADGDPDLIGVPRAQLKQVLANYETVKQALLDTTKQLADAKEEIALYRRSCINETEYSMRSWDPYDKSSSDGVPSEDARRHMHGVATR